jgi:drug/metabolite transporter (DMT)-like permease
MKISQSPLFLGLLAIFCWGSLATFGNLLLHLPPFYILGVTFLLGSLLALRHPTKLFINWKISIWGILGYYGYHFFLFYSFRYAPAIEANLINYLWPILLILLTPIFFPGSKIKSFPPGIII